MRERFQFEYLIWLVPAIMLLLATLGLPYEYYLMLRIVVTVCFGYIFYLHFKYSRINIFLPILLVFVVLYNPLYAVHFEKPTWIVLYLLAAFFLVIHMALFARKLTANRRDNY